MNNGSCCYSLLLNEVQERTWQQMLWTQAAPAWSQPQVLKTPVWDQQARTYTTVAPICFASCLGVDTSASGCSPPCHARMHYLAIQ